MHFNFINTRKIIMIKYIMWTFLSLILYIELNFGESFWLRNILHNPVTQISFCRHHFQFSFVRV